MKTLLYLWSMVFTYCLFLTGYFPITPGDYEKSNMSELPTELKRSVNRLVIIVIDALRADFVVDLGDKRTMDNDKKITFLTRMVEKGEAMAFLTTTNPPTVTLPRIKAMTTGTVPGFVDVVRNFDSSGLELTEDSLIYQWTSAGRNIVFYGDDTWTRLFPQMFLRQESTTSFYVSDYTEVDDNVTRHIETELTATDWDVMILHYLGLDHIGHLSGPTSPLVQPKLDEMGDVVEYIWSRLEGENNMVVIVGDHGMSDSGSHGGSSQSELLVPLIVLGGGGVGGQMSDVVSQVDLVPSLALLTGVPIPKWSLGCLLTQLFPSYNLLSLLTYNFHQLANVLEKMDMLTTAQEMVREASLLEDTEMSTRLFTSSLREMQKKASNNLARYDTYKMFLAILLLSLSLFSYISSSPTPPLIYLLPPSLCLLSLHCIICSYTTSDLCIISTSNTIILLITVSLISIHIHRITNITIPLMPNLSHIDKFIIFGEIIHMVSLFGSSYIEEEHFTYYYLFATLLIFITISSPLSLLYIPLMALLLHRLATSIHQTGDKWRHIPGLSNYLILPSLQPITSILTTSAISYLCVANIKLEPSFNSRFLKTIMMIILYIQKLSLLPPTPLLTQSYYLLLLLDFLLISHQFSLTKLSTSLQMFTYILHSQTNILVITMASIIIRLIIPFLKNIHHRLRPVFFLWAGKVIFFSLGNSNSLATIEVGAGYIGLSSYNPLLVPILLSLHTFTGPVTAVMEYIRSSQSFQCMLDVIIITLGTEMVVFCCIASALRYHLFVWTVFSPKLLYIGMYLLVMTVMSTVISLVK